jgi:molybdopterin-guanine dinucleotide biosynthesis protein A
MYKNLTAIVIAGGKSSRMGQNKSLIIYQGTRLIDNAIHLMENFTQNLLISSNADISTIFYPIIADDFSEIGPISGLYTCLKASKTELNLVIPCDVPYIKPVIYQKLLENTDGYDAVIPRLPNGKIEPLVACYKKSVLPVVLGQINLEDYKMIHLLDKLNVNYIDFEDAEQFKNMNTPNDLL